MTESTVIRIGLVFLFIIRGQLLRSKCVQNYTTMTGNQRMLMILTYLQSTCTHVLNHFYSCLFANFKLRNTNGLLPDLEEQLLKSLTECITHLM